MHNTNLMASEEKNCYASSSNFLIFNKTDNLFLFKENDISRDYAEKNEIAGLKVLDLRDSVFIQTDTMKSSILLLNEAGILIEKHFYIHKDLDILNKSIIKIKRVI